MSHDAAGGGRTPPSLELTLPAMTVEYGKDRLAFLLRTVREHGPVVQVAPEVYLVAGPASSMDVFRATGDAFRLPLNLTRDAVEGRRGTAAYDAWMDARHEISTALKDPVVFAEHEDWLAGQVAALADDWAGQGALRDPMADLEKLASRSVARFLVGADSPAGEDEIDRIAALSQEFVRTQAVNSETPIELPRWMRPLAGRYRRMHAAYRGLGTAIESRLAQAGPQTLGGRLRDAGMPTEKTVEVGAALMAAGTSIPATAFLWSLVALAEYPELADAPLDPDLAPGFLAEVLRMWPPAWLMRREATRDVEVDGWTVPAGATVMLSPYAVHHTAEVYDEPEEFRPARWEGLRPPPGAYIPYGAGRHWCVGRPLAELERATIVRGLAERLVVTRDRPLEVRAAATLQPVDPALRVARR